MLTTRKLVNEGFEIDPSFIIEIDDKINRKFEADNEVHDLIVEETLFAYYLAIKFGRTEEKARIVAINKLQGYIYEALSDLAKISK